jgi:type IV secretion system protein TrbL
LLDAVCEAGKSALGAVGNVATAPVRAAASGAMEILTTWVAESAQWVLGKVVSFIDSSTSPDLDAEWFRERYDLMAAIALFVLLPILVLAAVRALFAQDLHQLLKCFGLYLPGAVLGMFVAIHLTQILLLLTDQLSAAVSGNVADDTTRIFKGVGKTLSGAAGGDAIVPSFAIFIAAILLIVGSFFVWLELLVRSAAVTVAVFFLPLTFAGAVWPNAGSRIARRLIETLFALIVSKFVIVGVISLATAAMSNPDGGGFGTVMGAVALMLMAAFAPFAILKLIPVMESSAANHMEALRYRHQSQLYHRSGSSYVGSIIRSTLARHGLQAGRSTMTAAPAAAVTGPLGSAGIAAASAKRATGATGAKTGRAAETAPPRGGRTGSQTQTSVPPPRQQPPPTRPKE